jgi:hypothetical protein
MVFIISQGLSSAWHDETHLAIAKAAGYTKWYNSAGADMAKIKAHDIEGHNHYVNNPPGTVITTQHVRSQVPRYNQIDKNGHLYGAIVTSLKDYIAFRQIGKYGEYHLAYCSHYIGDLSQPLHNIRYGDYNKKNHTKTDGIINEEILENPDKIKIYHIAIDSEDDLEKEIARIANLSMKLGYRLEAENRLLSAEEAYVQVGHSASLLKAVLKWLKKEIFK